MRALHILSISAVGAAAALALTGCVMPAGPVVSEERDIDAVTSVVFDAAGDVTITEGEPSLVIHARQGAMARLTSEVSDDTLTIGATEGFLNWALGEVRYELTLPDLESLELNGSGDVESAISTDGTLVIEISGSGDVELAGIDAERVEAIISGSGGIDLAGSTTELLVKLGGSGDIDTSDLLAEEANVEIGGSGDVSVDARDNLVVRISGSGTVEYSGDPVVDDEISGSGEVRRAD